MTWQVYLLACGDGSYYCGITTDIQRRLLEHNGARPGGARYTSARRPVKLLAVCERASRSEAAKLETEIKKLSRNKKLQTLSRLANAFS